MANFETVTYQSRDKVGIVTLNRPQARNALNRQMRLDLLQAIKHASQDESTRVIIIAAAGEGFCAGADLTEPMGNTPGAVTVQLKTEYMPALLAIVQSTKPVIAAVNGAAAGIGAALALNCDLCVMAEDAYFYSAFGAISLIPDGGLHWLLANRIGAKKTYEIILESQRLDAAQCLQLGLINKVVTADQLLPSTLAWAQTLVQKAPLTARYAKQVLTCASEQTLEQSMNLEAELQDNCIRSKDFQEGATAFFEKRAAVFQGK